MHKKKLTIRKNVEATSQSLDEEEREYFKLTYFSAITTKFKKKFKTYKLNLAFTSKCKLKNILESTKDNINNIEKSGIYKINSIGCNAEYIGLTKRKLKQRLISRISDIKNSKFTTALCKHIKNESTRMRGAIRFQNKHEINENNIKLLKEVYTYKELLTWESIYI